MPRPRARALFELGGHWIAAEPGKPGLYQFWFDAGTGRTRRASLGTADLETAKTLLAEIVIKGRPKGAETHLSIVLEDYFLNHTDHLPSKDPARNAGRILLECWGAMIKTGSITEERQKRFIDWSMKRGHSLSYVARNLGVLAAALKRAKIPHSVVYSEGVIIAKWPDIKPKIARKTFIPSDDELVRILRAPMPENLRRWILNSMATVGRPAAVLELGPASRDKDARLIALNPAERRQNKKFRATVREPKIMTRWLDKWDKVGLGNIGGRYCGYASVDSIDTALRRICARKTVNLPQLSVKSFRHKGTTVLRKAAVPVEQISYQLGHRRPEERSTRGYGEYDPNYLAEATAALDAWITRILRLAQNPVIPLKSHRVA
jgi:hypothetical protein